MMRHDIDINLIKRTELLATEGHKHQTRKSGEPFIEHPMRVVEHLDKYMLDNLVDSERFYTVYNVLIPLGWLHDLVEDTDFILEDVEVLYGKEISSRLEYLTRDKSKEDYFEYGTRIMSSKDKLVYLVKLADLKDNLNSVGDGAFSTPIENKLRMRWEWLQFHLLDKIADCR